MSRDKLDRACNLYDAISRLDDRNAMQALAYRKRSAGVRVAVILAACLAVVLMFAATFGIISNIFDAKSKTNSSNDLVQTQPPQTLAAVLEQNRSDYSTVNAESIDLFDNSATLIWRYTDSEGYCTKNLSETEYNMLISQLGKGSKTDSGNASQPSCMVWISYGNGMVVSPYLEYSYGNIGFGSLFDYNYEIEPSSSFYNCVDNLLG